MESSDLQAYISTRIKNLRKAKGISQEKLSEMAGLGTKAVQNIETQKYDYKIQTITRILDALAISKEEFFGLPFSKHNQHLIEQLLTSLDCLPDDKQATILKAIIQIVENLT